jgi:glucosamine-6-phosphate deaminase
MTRDSSAEPPAPIRSFRLHGVEFRVYESAQDLGAASAHRLAAEQVGLAKTQDRIGFLLMAAPSAFPFYSAYLRLAGGAEALRGAIARTDFFQFDDYPLAADHPASFRHLLETNLFGPLRGIVPEVRFHPLNVDGAEPDAVCREYARRVLDSGPDLQLKGVGENGHWGFHEPGIPLDGEPAYIRVTTSVENVAQQLRDHPALFRRAGDVPREAYTANVPLFLRTRVAIEDNVPQPSKAFALLAGYGSAKVDAAVPTSALKRHRSATVRATAAAAWALELYADRGRIGDKDVRRLATALTGASDAGRTSSYIMDTLDRMEIEVAG